MFHPVGSQPPSVYWRRRLLAAGSLVILIVLIAVTISVASGGSDSPAGGSSGTPVGAGGGTTPISSRTPSSRSTSVPSGRDSSSPATGNDSSSPGTDGSSTGSGSVTVHQCRTADLDVAAVVGRQSYRVGQRPKVELKVTNDGSAPCSQDLADKQVVLKVYNGVSRVWGSHDCQIQPGTKPLTLAVGAPVLITVKWSGETSQPNCAGTRQHVGAGTYTLYASLSGKTGTSTKFTIS